MAKYSRREFLGGVLAVGAAGAIGCKEEKSAPPSLEEKETPTPVEYEPLEPNAFFDGNPEYLQSITPSSGEYTREERQKRRTKLKGGEEIFQDVGLTFYLVKPGDTLSEIRQRLSRYPQYAHLGEQRYKLDSFNIPPRKLRAHMWIPIPMEEADRHLTEAQFIHYAGDAIDELRDHEAYGDDLARILVHVSERELIATMYAIAKQEGGGKPLGQFELHRWEAHQQAFSFSYFHVLMKGPGLTARRKLNLTEGQLYHPHNAVKLFIGFLVEKSAENRKQADRFFPLPDHMKEFAVFYNGRRWETTNPHYIENVTRYYEEALAHLSPQGDQWRKEIKPD